MPEVSIVIVSEQIQRDALTPLMEAWHHTMVKGVVDIARNVIALGGEWHMDANVLLLADGSNQKDVWGFNLYPEEDGDAALEYISLINIRPAQGNRDMEIEDADIREKVRAVVAERVPFLGL